MAGNDFKPVRPCIKCGAADRNKKGACRSCAKAHGIKYRSENKDKLKVYFSGYYIANCDHLKSKAATRLDENRSQINKSERERYVKENHWREKNPDRYRVWLDEYLAANSELRRIYEHNRRAKKKESGGSLSRGLSGKLFKLQKGKCPCCGLPLGNDFHMDHKMPLALGGLNVDANMQLLRSVCNMNKSAKDPLLFMQSRGFLI